MRKKKRRFSSTVPSKAAGSAAPPVRADRLSGPHRTLLGRCLVADRKKKIEAGAVRRGELVPALRAQIPGFVVQLVEQLERQWMYRALGMAPRAEAFEL